MKFDTFLFNWELYIIVLFQNIKIFGIPTVEYCVKMFKNVSVTLISITSLHIFRCSYEKMLNLQILR